MAIRNFIGESPFSYFVLVPEAIRNWILGPMVTLEPGERLYTYSFQWFAALSQNGILLRFNMASNVQ
jgi:hypothetical protein